MTDVAVAFQEPRGAGVAEFVKRGVFHSCLLGDGFESPEQMGLSPAFGSGEDPLGGT